MCVPSYGSAAGQPKAYMSCPRDWLNATPWPPTTSVRFLPSSGLTTAAPTSKLMSSLASHCGVVIVAFAVQVPNGALPSLYAGTKTQSVWYAPSSFTQCPAVSTTLVLALVSASPLHEALRPWEVKNARPAVFSTAPPPGQSPPPS